MLANACTQQEADAAAAMPAVFVFQQAHAHLALVLRDFVTANTTAGTAGSSLFPCAPSKKWHSGELAVAALQYEVGRAPIIYRLADALACFAAMAPIGPRWVPRCH